MALAFLIGASPILAGTEELESAIMQTIDWDQIMVPLDSRQETTKAIQAYWQDFDNRVPRLSPAEVEYVETELGGSNERVNRVLNSREYALWKLNQTVDGCITAIQSVIKSQQDNSEAEMFFWLKVLNCYNQTEDTMIYLQQADLSNGRRDGAFKMRVAGIVQSRIVNYIAPSAMANTMGWTFSED